jgi:hypothetical protein
VTALQRDCDKCDRVILIFITCRLAEDFKSGLIHMPSVPSAVGEQLAVA